MTLRQKRTTQLFYNSFVSYAVYCGCKIGKSAFVRNDDWSLRSVVIGVFGARGLGRGSRANPARSPQCAASRSCSLVNLSSKLVRCHTELRHFRCGTIFCGIRDGKKLFKAVQFIMQHWYLWKSCNVWALTRLQVSTLAIQRATISYLYPEITA